MKKIPMLEKFAAQSLVEYNGELIFSKEKFAELIVRECAKVCDDLDIDDWGDKSFDDGTYYCSRAIKQHFGVDQYNEQEALNRAGDDIARDIDRQVILQAGLIHEGGGYAISTHEKQAEFAAKRNYTYSDIVSDGGMDPRK